MLAVPEVHFAAANHVVADLEEHRVRTLVAMPFATHAKRRPNAVLFAAPQSSSPSGIRAASDGGVLPEHVLSSILSSAEDPWTRASQATARTTEVTSSTPMAIGGGASPPQLCVHTGLAGDGDERHFGGAGDEVKELCEGFGRTTLLGSDAEFETAYSIGDELGRGGWATVFTARRRRRGSAAKLVDQGSRGSVPSPDPLLLLASATGWPPPAMASGAGHGLDGEGLAVKVYSSIVNRCGPISTRALGKPTRHEHITPRAAPLLPLARLCTKTCWAPTRPLASWRSGACATSAECSLSSRTRTSSAWSRSASRRSASSSSWSARMPHSARTPG